MISFTSKRCSYHTDMLVFFLKFILSTFCQYLNKCYNQVLIQADFSKVIAFGGKEISIQKVKATKFIKQITSASGIAVTKTIKTALIPIAKLATTKLVQSYIFYIAD